MTDNMQDSGSLEWTNSGVEPLRGKRILGVFVGDMDICFRCEDGDQLYRVDGDCCSESWFADLWDIQNLIGGTVISIREMPQSRYEIDEERCRQDYDYVCGIELYTEKGMATIIYRNSSNGYYGGWISKTNSFIDTNLQKVKDNWKNTYKKEY